MDILVLDDEKEITELVELYLRNEGFQVRCFYTGEAALASVKQSPPDLAILDVMLPDMDGFSVCRELRKKYTFPILMLTARVEDMDKINGLAIGADDYITKPFNPLELTARVKAQLRRYTRYNEASAPELSMDVGNLSISKETHECTLNGKRVSLTPIEFDILWLLCENREKLFLLKSFLKKSGGINFWTATTLSWCIFAGSGKNFMSRPEIPVLLKLSGG